MKASRLAVPVLAMLIFGVCANPAAASWGHASGEGGQQTIYQGELRRWGDELAKQIAAGGDRYEYKTTDACGDGRGSFDPTECYKIALLCPGEPGPLVDISRRTVSATGVEVSPWAVIGQTCLPNDVPGAAKRPTIAMIVNAMHNTPWAKAAIGFQPKGYKTLVNLPSYYAASWSSAGYGPGEVDPIDPATMYGYNVEVRPKLISFVYHFGDGSSLGPTTSRGGVYPSGDIRHTYAKPGTYRAHVTVVWGADFRVNGGAWVEVPDMVSVDQPGAAITVAEAHARLVTG